LVAVVTAVLALPAGAGPVAARPPVSQPGHLLGKAQVGTDAAVTPAGFEDRTVFSGLTHPTNIQFASDGRVFVAEKSGLVKVFDNLADTTPTVFADLRGEVDDYWDRGLLGLALAPNFPANPWVYVLYTYDAPIGGSPPAWNDACPTPPGPTTDGCVVSGRLSRLQANGNVMTGQEQVLINDWCQQFPSHSIGTVRFGPDGALYVSGGDGASFNGADYGQWGGTSGSPTPANPCGDPPGAVGTALSLPTAEGGALRSQDIRTMPGSGAGYAATVKADNPAAYWRLDDSGSTAADQMGSNSGTYSAGVTRGQPGATADGDTAVDLNGTSGYISVNDASALRLADGPFTLEAWVNRPTLGATYPGDQEQVFDKNDGGYQINIQNNVVYFDQAGIGTIARATTTMGTGWHHIVATKNGATVHIYQDGVEVTGPVTNKTLTDGSAKLVLGARRGTSTAFLDGQLDEVAIYRTALSAAQVAAHYAARLAP
jgi:glucose/arabinose dehydrogenase